MKKQISFSDTNKTPAEIRKDNIVDLKGTAYNVLLNEPKYNLGYDAVPDTVRSVEQVYNYLTLTSIKSNKKDTNKYMWIGLIVLAAFLMLGTMK